MKLEKLNRAYKSEEGEVKNIILLGNVGTQELYNTVKKRLGDNKLYRLTVDGWRVDVTGCYPESIYGIEERDFHLFEAYNHLEGDGEMIGYGDNSVIESGYEYFAYSPRVNEFFMFPYPDLIPDQIYARRKKEEEKPSDELKLTGVELVGPEGMSIPLKTATYEKLKNICSKEKKTLPEKISEWVDADNAQKKAKRSRADVMKDIKKELEDAWSEDEHLGVNTKEVSEMAGSLFEIMTEGGIKFK